MNDLTQECRRRARDLYDEMQARGEFTQAAYRDALIERLKGVTGRAAATQTAAQVYGSRRRLTPG